MNYDYSAVMGAAIGLGQFSGYLDSNDLKLQREAQERFNTARNHLVFDMLAGGDDAGQIQATIVRDIDEMSAADPYTAPTYAFVRNELLARVERESRKSPLLRTVVRRTPAAIGIAVVITYFAIRFFSAVTIDQPIDTRTGIEQRAQALAKVARYDDWASGGSRQAMKKLLLWPIEPTDDEIKGATEFVQMIGQGLGYLDTQKQICGGPTPGTATSMSKDEIQLVQTVATYINDKGTKWQVPPELTILEPIKTAYPCPSIPSDITTGKTDNGK